MSLLMDALKKAEEDKKQAAKRLEEVEKSDQPENTNEVNTDNESASNPDTNQNNTSRNKFVETVELSLEPLGSKLETASKGISEKPQEIVQKEVPAVDAAEVFSEELTLENPVIDEALEKTQEAIDLNDTTIIEGLSTEHSSAPFDDTFHGVLFEEDEKNTDIYEETLPGVPADQLVKDLGGGKFQPTPVAAQTVFTAGRTDQKNSSFKWGVLIVLVLLAVGSFSVFYYFTITPVVRKLPSPIVARGIESTSVPHTTITRPVNSEIVSGVIKKPESDENIQVINSAQTQQAPETVERIEPAITDTEIETPIVPTNENISDAAKVDDKNEGPVINETAGPEVGQNSIVNEEELEAAVSKRDTVQQEAPLTTSDDYIQPDLSLVNISKNIAPKKQSIMVKEAFKAYQAGQIEAAKLLYNNVIKSEPDNRDAHLGLAAIAIKNKDNQSAYEHYLHILTLNPNDALAHNALINLSNNPDPVTDESAIKILLQKEGDVPYLYFSLGILYAKQSRWPEAQQAFFEAYRLDTTNPDYVLNLAISLDHIGQYLTAYDYYKTAIALAEKSSSESFDYLSINNRINALSNVLDSKL